MEIQTRPQTNAIPGGSRREPLIARKTFTQRRAKPLATPRRSLRARALRYLEEYEAMARIESAEEDRRREEEAHRDPFPLEHFYDLLRRRLGVMPQECERAMMDEDTFYADVDCLRFSTSRLNSQDLLWYHTQCVVCGEHGQKRCFRSLESRHEPDRALPLSLLHPAKGPAGRAE
jgi:hypothetical protein